MAQGGDFSLYLILGISLFFLVGITVVMIYFVIRYRKSKSPKGTNIDHNNTLEITWTVIPTILVLIMFYYGWAGYKPMINVPDNAIEIEAHGQMWSWWFVYPNGKRSDTLVVPLNEPVKLNLISHDVIHSLSIPAFRVKQDVVPGKNNWMWFAGSVLGSYDIFCTEYCGLRHSYMLSKVNVTSEHEYTRWLTEKSAAASDEHAGLTVIKNNACLGCHSLDGTKLVGPSFKGIWGITETVNTPSGDKTITVNEEYIKRSLIDPNGEIVDGYNKGLMIPYQLSDEDFNNLIDYLKSLK